MSQDEAPERSTSSLSYTLAHPDAAFIHQHIVDAFTAQTANRDSKPIAVAFALIGLGLYLEKNYTRQAGAVSAYGARASQAGVAAVRFTGSEGVKLQLLCVE